MTRLARFSALALVSVPARVTGAERPESDMDMDEIGMPPLASST